MLGPGLTAGAANDDPTAIGTFATAGAALGPATLWTGLWTIPFVSVVQNICARVGLVTGHGLAGVLRARYARAVTWPAVALLAVANTVTLGADLAAIADSVGLLIGSGVPWLVVPLALAVVLLQTLASYRVIAGLFRWLTLALLAYVVSAVLSKPDLGATAAATLVPVLSLDPSYLATVVAIIGTRLSPYVFFWQSAQEVEERKALGAHHESQRRGASDREVRLAAVDTTFGMVVSNVIAFFIVLATASTLHAGGITEIGTGREAAEALRPLAGVVFAVGMIGAGLLAVPVLAASTAYAIADTVGWHHGLDERPAKAKRFYAVIAASCLAGAALALAPVPPLRALFLASLLNGIVAPLLLVLVMRVATDRRVMGAQPIGRALASLGWLVTLGAFATLALLAYLSIAPR